MRAALSPVVSSLLLVSSSLLSAAPAGAQALPPSGAGVSNAYNQSFQNQNQFRGLQQQQNFDTNTQRLQNSTNQMYNGARGYGPGIAGTGGYGPGVVSRGRRSGSRSGGRPERER